MDITRDPIPRLIRTMAVPASLGFFFNTMFNVVDTYYAGQLSTDALAALSLSFPIYFILISVGIGIQSGGSALIANALGSGDPRRAVRLQFQAVTLAVVTTVVLSAVLYPLLPSIYRFFGAEGEVLAGGLRYMRVIVSGGVLLVTANTLNAGLQARGDTRTFRNLLIAMSILNVGLDPLLMFGLTIGERTIVPAFLEAGTALSTVGLFGGGIVYLLVRGRRAGVFRDGTFRDLVPRGDLMRELVGQSLPAAMNFMIMTLGAFVINFFISRYGRDPIAAYGAALRIEQIALLPLLGINVALATLVGQNNGAGRLDRVEESFTTALRIAVVVSVAVLTPVIILAPALLRLFTENSTVVAIGRTYLYIQAITFFSYILMNMCNSVLQGLKRPGMIVWIGVYRQVAAPFVVFPLLAFTLGMEQNGVFWGLVIVNWTAAAFSYWWARRVLHQRRVHAGTPAPDIPAREAP